MSINSDMTELNSLSCSHSKSIPLLHVCVCVYVCVCMCVDELYAELGILTYLLTSAQTSGANNSNSKFKFKR